MWAGVILKKQKEIKVESMKFPEIKFLQEPPK